MVRFDIKTPFTKKGQKMTNGSKYQPKTAPNQHFG
jgi:hypothetical protein